MNQTLLALAFQSSAADDNSMWIILIVVFVILFFIVVIIAVGLTIFFIMRKRRKAALNASGPSDGSLSAGPDPSAYAGMSQPESAYAPMSQPESAYAPMSQPESTYAAVSQAESAVTLDPDLPAPALESGASTFEYSPGVSSSAATEEFDPSKTVAIIRENTVAISHGRIKFISGVLAGEQFDVEPAGAFIGRDRSLSQIVVADPRISKRHLWIGVRDGAVRIVDQDSRNGTFINDPKSERITEGVLNSGDTVIMGESDVARFEYQA